VPNPDLFVYIEPNADTTPRYQAVNAAYKDCAATVVSVLARSSYDPDPEVLAGLASEIRDACKNFYGVVQKVCPPSADRSAAERCIRLTRMLAIHALYTKGYPPYAQFVEMELLGAKLQANASISLALPHELPALELP